MLGFPPLIKFGHSNREFGFGCCILVQNDVLLFANGSRHGPLHPIIVEKHAAVVFFVNGKKRSSDEIAGFWSHYALLVAWERFQKITKVETFHFFFILHNGL